PPLASPARGRRSATRRGAVVAGGCGARTGPVSFVGKMRSRLRTISPIDGRCYVERELAAPAAIDAALDAAQRAQTDWRRVPLAQRVEVLGRAVQAFVANGAAIAEEITWQMGRPLRHSPSEIRGFEERARYMLAVAATALESIAAAPKPGFARQIKR